MSSRITRPIFNISHTGPVQRGTVILLHGSGDAGPDFWQWITHLVPDFPFRHLKIILPTAPSQPYTPSGGEISNVWFDRKEICRNVPELSDSIDKTAQELLQVINEEVASGIPLEKMVIGGFSMGGAMALHLGLRYIPNVAGIFALSSFINDDSSIFKISTKDQRVPPVLMWHGTRDPKVPMSWGSQSFETLRKIGVPGEFHIGQNALHELKKDCLLKVKAFIEQRLPPPKQPKI